MKRILIILTIGFVIISCSKSRTKDIDEFILSEFIYEENGIYYQHVVNHKKVEYSGKCEFFYFKNGNIKGRAIIKNGVPNGHWEYWNEDGSKRLDIYFENGNVIKKNKYNTNSINTDSINNQEYLGKRLEPIRDKFKEISEINEWTSMDKRKIERKEHSGAGIYYFLKGNLKKIRLIQTNENSKIFTEFYLNNDSLFFVFERHIDSLEMKKDIEFYEPFEDSLFFENGKLIRIKSNLDCGAPFAEDYLLKEEKRIKEDFTLLIKRLNNK